MSKVLLLLLVLLAGCCKEEIADNVPTCIKKKICREVKNSSEIYLVDEHILNDKKFYSFSESNIDGSINEEIYDSQCNFICSMFFSSMMAVPNSNCDTLLYNPYNSSVIIRNIWKK